MCPSPPDTSLVSFEAAHRPNYFLSCDAGGQLRLAKWEESKAFWDGATFILHRDTWITGFDSLESFAKPGFFIHATSPSLHLLKYRHTANFRKATLFRMTGGFASKHCSFIICVCVCVGVCACVCVCAGSSIFYYS